MRGGLVLALGMTAALLSPPARADGDGARLENLDRIEWSAAMADRYAAGRAPTVEERVWRFSRPIGEVVFSPDSRFALIGIWKKAELVDVLTGRQIHEWMHRFPSYVTDGAFSPDGRLAVTGAGDASARLWDVASGRMLYQWTH